MPLQERASKKSRSFDIPVSYRINESRDRLRDALNVFSNQGRLETRYGTSVYNSTSLGGSVLSLSSFRDSSNTRYVLAKVGSEIKSVATSGASSSIKTGLSSSTKHRALTWARGTSSRTIVACESDGLFQWNGTNFTQLGQDKPTAPTVASSATTGTLSGYDYNVYLTYYSSSTGFESNASNPSQVSISSSLVLQDLTYSGVTPGTVGNLISIEYIVGGTAGAEVVTVTGSAISIQIADGVSTALQVKAAFDRKAEAVAIASVSISGTESDPQTAVSATFLSNGRRSIEVSDIPVTATNATIDRVRVYLKESSSPDDAVFVTEFALGTTSYTITSNPQSTQTFPLSNGVPLSGGAKYLTEFNRKLVYAGSSTYPNDVFFSEEDLPDAFNDGTADGRLVLSPIYDGNVTGLATGLYNNSVLDPFLVVFKKRSTHIYSEITGEGKFIPISKEIGCVSHDTIQVKNGVVFFLSDQGWRAIENGRIIQNEEKNPATLGNGDVDDIFTQPGLTYEVNRLQMQNSFSVYYSTLDQYITWIAEGSNSQFAKAYSFEFKTRGFKPYSFYTPATCACVAEDSVGDEIVLFGDSNGVIYSHSIKESRNDRDYLGTQKNIEAFAMMTWMDGDDMDATYNFRELILRRVTGGGDLSVKTWVNYTINNLGLLSFDFPNPDSGFVLDENPGGVLDEGSFGDERTIVTARSDINRCGENILVGFYQSEADGNINLVSAQMDFNKNGIRN